MPSFGVTPKKEMELRDRMAACGLCEGELMERFVRSGGPGGQKVNRSATCVYLKHVPSGLEVKMQESRSQSLNRFYARRRMCELLEERQLGKESPAAKVREKVRKKKADKKRRSRKKHGSAKEKDPIS